MNALPPIGTPPIAAAQRMFPTDEVGPAQPARANAADNFGKLVRQGLDHVNEQLHASQTGLQRLAAGDAQNIHQVMIQLEESRLSFQLMLQIRGRLLEAYQDVMKMQI